MNRIDKTLKGCRDQGRPALVMFVSAGDPSLETSERLITEISAAGADIIEIGIPFSDPMADGPAIQAASQRALAAGANLPAILAMLKRLRKKLQTPFVLFSYYNVIMQYGVEKLAEISADIGIDGWLIVDVPAEESGEIRPALNATGIRWITLLAPTTPPERVEKLVEHAEGFVYYITVTGVTGAREKLPKELEENLEKIRSASPVPVVAGFGISSPPMARTVARHADGIVVGSALIQIMAQAENTDEGIRESAAFVSSLAEALKCVDPQHDHASTTYCGH